MKPKIGKPLWYIGALLLGVALCLLLYWFVDHVQDGAFLEWFQLNYMTVTERFYPEIGQMDIVREPMWWKIKGLLLRSFIAAVAAGITVVFLTAHFYAESQKRKTITGICRLLHSCMIEGQSAGGAFPREYAEISAQIAEIKAAMLRGEQALRYEAARRNDLVTYLAHDLKTPLTSVIGYLSLLEEAPDMPPEQKGKYTRIALDKAYRLEQLVNEFFEIARYNLQQVKLEKERIDLHYMLVQMTDEFYPLLSARGNTAALEAREDLTVYGDPAKLARVFNNILKNALAYSDPGSEIVITAGQEGGRVVLSFRNRGPAIPADKLSAIFEKFYRLDEARASGTGGAGLGLAIAKEIVEAHGGTISAQSGDGVTTFTVALPASEVQP